MKELHLYHSVKGHGRLSIFTGSLYLNYKFNVFSFCQSQNFGGISSQYNGGKLEEAEDFKCGFFVHCLFESK